MIVFLDRDGTINRSPPPGEYVCTPDELELLPGAADGIRLLRDAGATVVVVTNQRGIALGRMSESDLEAVHARLLDDLRRSGADVDAIYACPHEEGTCECRKPGTELFRRAMRELGADDTGAIVIGDSERDMEAAARLGYRGIRIGEDVPSLEAAAEIVVASLI